MKNKSLISRIITALTVALLPITRIHATAPEVDPAAAFGAIKLGAVLLLAKLLVTIVLSFFVLKKIKKASWTPSVVAVALIADVLGTLVPVALMKSSTTEPHIIIWVAAITLPSFLLKTAIWYTVFGKKYPKTALLLTGISALYPVTTIILRVFYWATGIGY